VVAVSTDDLETAREHAFDDELPFELASDVEMTAIRAWGVRHKGQDLAVPSVFVVDRDSVLRFAEIGESINDRALLSDLLAVLEEV
jgi:peroxiredoxin